LRVALATLGSLGDLNPFLGVGRALAARGHAVTVATSPTHAESVAAAGLGFHPVPPDLEPDDQEVLRLVLDRRSSPKLLHQRLIFPYLEEGVDAFLPLAAQSDMVVTGVIAYFARVAADQAGVPWMGAQLSPMCMWSAHDPSVLPPAPWLARLPIGATGHRLLLRAGLRWSEAWAAPERTLRRARGLPDRGNPFAHGQFSEHGTLAMFSRHFAAPQPDWPAGTVQPGFALYDGGGELEPELAAFLEACAEPPVVYTLGSTTVRSDEAVSERLVDAAHRTGLPSVVLVGAHRRDELEGSGDDTVHVSCAAPYSKLFGRARLVVHQGGVGTTAEALRAGMPQVVLPHCNDQPDNAARVERLGVAHLLPWRTLTPARLAEAVRALHADRSAAEGAAELGRAISAEDGPGTAAETIERACAGS
jgi:UDP:flavonoid glycosyltransferase YjiC (YdhE family)